MEHTKGYQFEKEVEKVLRDLEKKFPDYVEVVTQQSFTDVLRPHRADFELKYKMGGLTHHHLIECQNRERSSPEIADKIYSIRGTTDRNRYIFVHKDKNFLSEPLEKRFNDMGVLSFEFEDFKKSFISQLEADIALKKIGGKILKNPFLKNYLSETNKDLLDSASKFDDNSSSPPDKSIRNIPGDNFNPFNW